jgi:transcriptional regulator with XRE-family HTH domain
VNQLKHARKAAGLSAAKLADLAGTREMRVYAFERERHRPRAEEAQRIAEVLHCDVRELFPNVIGGAGND